MIYAIQAGDFIKLGFSTNPRNRLSTIGTSCPLKCVLLGTMNGTRRDEKLLHEKFSSLRANKEWFHSDDSLLDWIEKNMVSSVKASSAQNLNDFSADEAAKFLAVSVSHIHDLMDAGEIKFVYFTKPSNVRRIRRPTRKSVMEFAANRVVLANVEV